MNDVDGSRPSYVVGVGASAGGLEALGEMFSHALADDRVCYVVVVHLAPDHRSLIAELLSKQTTLRVERAQDGTVIEGNTVYVIEPRTTLRCEGNQLRVEPYQSERHLHRPIDLLFESLASSWGAHAAAVVLSGTGTDGSRGARAIKAAGGLVVAQRPDTAAFDGMPNALIITDQVDIVLRPSEVCREISGQISSGAFGGGSGIAADEETLTRVLSALRRHTDVDFSRYKPTTIARRVERRRGLVHAETYVDYAKLLESNETEAKRLCSELLIGVTQFFRDPENVAELAEVLAGLAKGRREGAIRAWVAGCSTGEEAYTVAILLSEAVRGSGREIDFKVFATDVNEKALQIANVGRYPMTAVVDVPAQYLARYFEQDPAGGFGVTRALRDRMVFSRHDLLRDPPFSNLDLVTCRNVLIYLLPDAQIQLVRVFAFALRREGLLWLGPSESPPIEDTFEAVSKSARIYRAAQAGGRAMRFARALPPRAHRPPSRTTAQTPPAHRSMDSKLFLDLASGLLPPYVIFDDGFEVRFQSRAVHRFLHFEDGPFTPDVRRLMTRDVRTLVVSAVERQRAESDEDVVFRGVNLGSDADAVPRVSLRIRKLVLENAEPWTALFFEPEDSQPPATELAATIPATQFQERIESLEQQLESANDRLRATVAKFEASNEELQSTNEEVLASNEELQSVNEELQSVNEELHTVNAELQSKLQELSRVNADLDEVLATVDTGILVLDDDLKIRRFNQRATNFVRIVGHDAGRPLSHLSHSFAGTSILDDCARTAREHVGVERVLFSDDGARVLFRTKPIRSAGRDGVLVSFSDVTSIETLEDAAQRLNEAVEQLDSPVVLLDKEGSIIYANRCFSDLSRRDAAFLPGTAFVDLLDESSRSGFAAALEQVRAGKPWHGTSALDVPNSPPILEETRLRPLFSKTGSLIGVARFSAALPDLGRNVRILLVEDNAGDAMLVEERLRLDGVINHFQWVTSAEAALERLDRSSAESLPDLILIDLGLPLISGEELLRIVKSDVRYAHIAVAILTGADVAVREQALYDRGAVAIVRKPVDLDGFRQILRRLEGFWFSMVRYGSPSQDELERSSKVE